MYEGPWQRNLQHVNAKKKEHNVDKYIQWVTMLLLTILVCLHSFSCYCLPNLRNSPKIQTYSSSRSLILVSIELIRNFLLLINSNYGRISYQFKDIDAFSLKIACFSHPTLV